MVGIYFNLQVESHIYKKFKCGVWVFEGHMLHAPLRQTSIVLWIDYGHFSMSRTRKTIRM